MVEVRTSSQVTLTAPPVLPSLFPHALAIAVQDLQEADLSPAGVYRMVSIPLRFGAEFTGTLETLLADQTVFGSYNPTCWRAFRWHAGEARYVELAEDAYAAEFRPEPGRAFWRRANAFKRMGISVRGSTVNEISTTSLPNRSPSRTCRRVKINTRIG